MQILPGPLSGIALILFIVPVKPGYYTQKKIVIATRAFLDPIDYSLGKKSCIDGYVHGIDNFIVTGFLNVTGYNLTLVPAYFNVMYLHPLLWIWNPISFNHMNLREEECTDIQHVPLDQCGCEYESNMIIRVKCNVTAHIEHTDTLVRLQLITDRLSISEEMNMTKVYRDTSCAMGTSINGGTRSHGWYDGMPGHILLVTALVSTVKSMVLYG
ncbi:unnamed protein product [Lymnaea stagnalis]|uniref:Uncharacterized protein n=1 Tax=Lymnaea stagnalis TaxID=6523 RepID=A0AAV2HEW1_LYMST